MKAQIDQLAYAHPGFFTTEPEVDGVPSSSETVELLTKGHEQVVKTSRIVLKVAQAADVESTASLVSDRMRIHEKTAWMVRATKKV